MVVRVRIVKRTSVDTDVSLVTVMCRKVDNGASPHRLACASIYFDAYV